MTPALRTSGPRAIVGTPYKLISQKGTLLGVLTVPDWIADRLTKQDTVQFQLVEEVQSEPYPPPGFHQLQIRVAGLARSYHPLSGDGVILYGASIEEVEQQRGFSFSPSAAYLRSLIE